MSIFSIFVFLSIFSVTLIQGFKLNFLGNIQRNRRLSMIDPSIGTFISNLGVNAVPAAVGLYLLSSQNNALEKTLAAQNNSLNESLAAQDKSQKESLSALEKALAAQDKSLKESLAAQDKSLKESLSAQDKLWNARFEKVSDHISK